VAGDWLNALQACRDAGEGAVLVTIVAVAGSAPREPGAKMVVAAARQHGTIGGGMLEHQAVQRARRMLREGVCVPAVEELPLGPALGQCCGGRVTLMLEPVVPPSSTLYLFGAGHVGREVVAVLSGLPDLLIVWIDGRDGQFPAELPDGVRRIVSELPEAEALEAPAGSAFLVMTHSHDLDFRLVETVLRRGEHRWLGLIGSATKRARFLRRLQARGLDGDSLVCPIGIEGIRGKHPRTIAIAVAAQLLRDLSGAVQPAAGREPTRQGSC
jgi:xanthine dehydrogenase accessory factor